ncbi:thermonuclease family protein [Lishizhenia tianjinensis]|uniref:thermonuclease family protein n=1 Tax=Lishizhenia tianjinensis TaxID=477690 RepID=UPI00147D5050|nr:thermonuclease family protein [Lishizhenia tianjinensis]
MIGLNTPELKGRNQEKEFYAEEAKKFLADLIYQKEIRLEFDVEHKDKYGRTLAYVYVFDTLFVNELLIAKGYAQKMRIPPNTKYASQFAAREQMAKARKIGIWQKP